MSFTVTPELLTKTYPLVDTAVVEYINKYKDQFDINTDKRLASFLANCIVESWGFKKYTESTKYTSPLRLRQVFPRTVPTLALARQLVAGGAKVIANYVYGTKNGNRGRNTDDGWNYRGRGAIQITGRTNYELSSKSTGNDYLNHPELLETHEHAIISAMDWWKRNGCNELADKLQVDKDGTILKRTKNYSTSKTLGDLRTRINGAKNHIQDVGIYYDTIIKNK